MCVRKWSERFLELSSSGSNVKRETSKLDPEEGFEMGWLTTHLLFSLKLLIKVR